MKIQLIPFIKQTNTGFSYCYPQLDNLFDGSKQISYVNSYAISKSDALSSIQSAINTLSSASEIKSITFDYESSQYGSDIWVEFFTCELAETSQQIDYTDILTAINTNLTDLNSKFQIDSNNSIVKVLGKIYHTLTDAALDDTQSNIKSKSFFRKILRCFTSDFTNVEVASFFYKIFNCLKQSISPNASITDVISALNSTIDSKQNTMVVNNEVTPLAEINIDVPFEVKNLKKSDVESL